MFVCDPCYSKSPSAYSYSPWPVSFGRCEDCGRTAGCHDVRIVPKPAPKEPELPEGWLPMNLAPDHRLILVQGPSGYTKHQRYYCSAYRDPDWHGGEFNDVTGTPLSDKFGIEGAPIGWRELP